MVEFQFNKNLANQYILRNTGTLVISYTITTLINCVDYTSYSTGTVGIGEEVIITIPEDAKYRILLQDGTNDDTTVSFNHFENLKESIIKNVFRVLCPCDCGCNSCFEPAENKYCDLLMAKAKIDVYKNLISPEATSFFEGITNYASCLIKKPTYCAVAEEVIVGESECNETLIKQLIALDYLALYFYDYNQQSTQEEKDSINEEFKTEEIFCCIKQLGINVGDIENLINENMGLFTITSGQYINQAPTVGDNNISVDNRATTVLTSAMFTSQTTPAYSDIEGDAPLNLRIDSLPADGILILDGTNVVSGQIIPFTDVDAGLLIYSSPDQDALDTDQFNFSISDAGSGLFGS